MSLIFPVLLLLFFAGDALWWIRARRRIQHQPWRGLATLFFVIQLAGISILLISRFGGLAWDTYLPRPVLATVYLWHLLFIVPWMLFIGVIEIGKGILALARWIARAPIRHTSDDGISRREFLTSAVALAPAVLTGGAALASETHLDHFRVRSLELKLPTLPAQLDGLTIAHVSDTHVGRFTNGTILAKISDEVNKMNADLVLMTGDLIDFSIRDLPTGIELMKSLRSKHGTYLCEGNHDLFQDPEQFRRTVLRSGLALLRDQQLTLPIRGVRLQLLGLAWVGGHRVARAEAEVAMKAQMDRMRRELDEHAFPILLGHHPHSFDHAQGVPLMLAGHTHGGQLMLDQNTGFGPWLFRYWSGLYQKEGRALVVSNGTGNWFPLRINAPAELIHLTLRRAG
jgi:predicted MPP superfamily phosphohydrolase